MHKTNTTFWIQSARSVLSSLYVLTGFDFTPGCSQSREAQGGDKNCFIIRTHEFCMQIWRCIIKCILAPYSLPSIAVHQITVCPFVEINWCKHRNPLKIPIPCFAVRQPWLLSTWFATVWLINRIAFITAIKICHLNTVWGGGINC